MEKSLDAKIRRILADPDVTATAVDFLAARRNRLAVVR